MGRAYEQLPQKCSPFSPRRLLQSTLYAFSPNKTRQPARPLTISRSTSPPTPPLKASLMTWVTLELSNYPPRLMKVDVLNLFNSFVLKQDFVMPEFNKFHLPLRTKLQVYGETEAQRAVEMLDGAPVQGRKIKIKLAEDIDYEGRETIIDAQVEELRAGIINVARIWHPQYEGKFLDVEERVNKNIYFAYLQLHPHINRLDNLRERSPYAQVHGERELLYSGMASAQHVGGRLQALNKLQKAIVEQSYVRAMWEEWENEKKISLDQFE